MSSRLKRKMTMSRRAGSARPHRGRAAALPGNRHRIRRLRGRFGRPPEDAAVERAPLRRDRREKQLIARDLDDHEMVLRKSGFVERALVEGVESPPAATGDEIPNPVLRRDPLVEMLVPREDDVDLVAHERRFERRSNAVAALLRVLARRKQRVMEEADAPSRAGVPERGVEPRQLRGVGGMIAVQRHEPRIAFRECEVQAIGHVKRLVVLFELAVVVSDRRVEDDALLQQPAVRQREFVLVVVVVEVVAEHQHECEPPRGFVVAQHRVRDVALRRIAAAAVADEREARRARNIRQREHRPRGGASDLLRRRP
jgi:hypothetical protein